MNVDGIRVKQQHDGFSDETEFNISQVVKSATSTSNAAKFCCDTSKHQREFDKNGFGVGKENRYSNA